MPGKTAAFSFEKSPTAWAAARPASHATLRRPVAEAPLTWHSKPARHAEGRQQVGAPHNIGDRFGEQRMQSPNRGQRQSRRRFPKNQHAQRIHQRHVDFVQHEINPVIARRARAIAENCVIQQVGESGERPIQSRGGRARAVAVPIPSRQNGLDVLRALPPGYAGPPQSPRHCRTPGPPGRNWNRRPRRGPKSPAAATRAAAVPLRATSAASRSSPFNVPV